MKYLKLLVLLLFAFSFSGLKEAHATHVMGSEIKWECLGKDTFKITVRVYRDCNGVRLSATALQVRSAKCGTRTYATSMSLVDDITPVCDEQCTRCDSRSCSFEYGIQAYDLTTTVILTDWRKRGCCDITISWQQCCRNNAITTGARSQNFYVEGKMNICQDPCDNSPSFTGAPLALICLGRDFIYNQGVQDKDVDPKTGGLVDSLVFSFADPLTSATGKTTWNSGYSSDKPIYFLGFPKSQLPFPRGFHLDSVTGDLMFRPMREEQTVISFKVEEYRDGVLIGVTRRDVQIIVIKCPNNNPPVISGINCSQPKPQNFSTDACAGETICFTVCTSDKDKGDTVTIDWNAGIPGATFEVINKGDKRETGRFCWTPQDKDVGTQGHKFLVTAKDDACPVNGFTGRAFSIVVKATPKAKYDTLIYDCGEARFTAERVGKVNIQQYQWALSGRLAIKKGGDYDTTYHHYKYPGMKPFSLTLYGKNGCNKTYVDTVTVPEYVNVTTTPDLTVCAGEEVELKATVANSVGKYRVDWSTGDKFKDEPGSTKITVGTRDTFVFAKITDEQCENSDTTFIYVNNPVEMELGDNVRICPGGEHEFGVVLTYDTLDADTNFTFSWTRDGLSNVLSTNDTLLATDSATYYLVVADSLGCTSEDNVSLLINPARNWKPNEKAICLNDTAVLKVKETSPGSVFEWWLSPSDSNRTPYHVGEALEHDPKESQFYGIKWTETLNNMTCTQYDSVYVKVNPLPDITLVKPGSVCENGDPIILSFNGSPIGGEWFDTLASDDYVQFGRFYPDRAGADGENPKSHPLFYAYEDPITRCKDTQATSITVKPLPIVELSEEEIPMCTTEDPRELGQYVVKVSGEGRWDGIGVSKVGNKFYFDPASPLVGYKPGIYELIYTYTHTKSTTAPFCSNSDTMLLRLIEVPKVEAGEYDSLCLNGPVTLLAPTPADGDGGTGEWFYLGTDISNPKPVAQSRNFNPANFEDKQEHFLRYVFTVENSECRASDSTSIKINPLPIPKVLTTWLQGEGKNKICELSVPKDLKGNTQDANGPESYINREWSGNGVIESGGVYKFDPADAGLGGPYPLTYEVTNIFGCVGEATDSITVDGEKKISFTNDKVCKGDIVVMDLTVENAEAVQWSTTGDGEFVNDRALNAEYEPGEKDKDIDFELEVATDYPDNVCAEVSASSTIRVHPLPEVAFDVDEIFCGPGLAIFANQSRVARGSIRENIWDYGNGETETVQGKKQTTTTIYGAVGEVDKFVAKLTCITDEGCEASAEKVIRTLKTPLAAFTPKPGVTTLSSPEVYFDNKSQYVNDENSTYEWDFGDDDPLSIDDEDLRVTENPMYRYQDTGSYDVKLIATNYYPKEGPEELDFACADEITKTIVIKPEIVIYIPTAFSPDGRGIEKNERFLPVTDNVQSYTLKIFNRWGELMWETNDLEESWDGTKAGIECLPDVYLYVVKAKNQEGRDYEFNGTITLLR